jgi:SAM-dependent methyltransferase
MSTALEQGAPPGAKSAGMCRACGGACRPAFRSTLGFSVTSACAVVPVAARVTSCSRCGLLQKEAGDLVVDYLHYDLFDNDPAADKIVRTPGQPDRTRSQWVAERLLDELGCAQTPQVLEVGCHRGAFLTALRARAPQLELHGFDIDAGYGRWIEPLCGPGRYHHGDLSQVPGPFEACVLIHTLEHVPAPVETLRIVRGLLRQGGCALIVVPDVRANVVDCYTADHACHFDGTTLADVLARAGFSADVQAHQIANELVATARPAGDARAREPSSPIDFSALTRFESGLRRLPEGTGFVFGTALIGALLEGQLGTRCLGFADEAPYRQGKLFHGKPVRHPRELKGQTVFLGVAENLAQTLAPRLAQLGLDVVDPWRLGSGTT